MPRETVIHAKDADCLQAVQAFAAGVARATCLRPRLTVVSPQAADVDFDDQGPAGASLRIEWMNEPDGAFDGAVDEVEEADGMADDTGARHAVEHYLRTFQALARNSEAARAINTTARCATR